MKKPISWLILVLLLAVLAGWFFMRREAAELAQVEVQPAPAMPAEPEAPPIRYPVDEIVADTVTEPPPGPPPEPLPTLEESDPEVITELADLAGDEPVTELLVPEFIVSRMVATLDTLTSARVAPQAMPLKPVPGKFLAMQSGEAAAISPQNAERYDALVRAMSEVDLDAAVAFYRRYYPLFQEAYEALGYPEGYFNDRLVEVIDHLLATPTPEGIVELVPNEANFDFADPDLQALSAGQKMMIRLGEQNGAVVRERLAELRAAITGPAPE